jgi:predicted ATPase/class 3 adenylate cyclase
MRAVSRALPSGTVTFLFTDIEGSTRLLHELGAERYAHALADHRRILREAFGAHGGVEVDTQGDAFFVAFPTAPGALAAAADAQERLAGAPIRVRIGIHTGTPHLTEEGYVGEDVHRAARIAAAGHGGQLLVSSAAAKLVGRDDLRDLGNHRLKDLSAPERIYQLGEDEFPPLKTLYQTNLPVPATPFLGRERELAQVQGLLSRDDVRLLTLTGPGGTGKTRLALQAAAESSDAYPDGVFWVPLAPLRDPKLVHDAAAATLGAKDGLAEHVSDMRLLLLFDNFEHVIEAADSLPPLLQSCPNLHLLVTSRELLRLPGEQAYPVAALDPRDGAELFLARARAAEPEFEPDDALPELCSRLEQLPLALELAAARVSILSLRELLERLSGRLDLLKAGRGVEPRQQSLRATIEWSYELLDPDERRLFARLAVFRGGCTLKAAETVCDADVDTLQSLVAKSLLRRAEERFWMLEAIREYAAERLAQSDETAELRRRHADYFLALAEEAEPQIRVYNDEWIERLRRELDNLRAALDELEALGEMQKVVRLAGALRDFWFYGQHLAEGQRRLEHALQLDDHPTAARAKALLGAGDMAAHRGDVATGKLRFEEALALYRTLEDSWGTAYAAWHLGYTVGNAGDLSAAQRLCDEAVRLFRELGDELYTLGATRTLAWTYEELGDLERARELHEDNVRRARAIDQKELLAVDLGALAGIALAQRRREDASSLLEESLLIGRDVGHLLEALTNVCRVCRVLAEEGRAEAAARLLSAAEALREELGAGERWVAKMNDETLGQIRAQLDEAALAQLCEESRGMTPDEVIALALHSLRAAATAGSRSHGV